MDPMSTEVVSKMLRTSSNKSRLVELYIWFIFGILVSIPYIVSMSREPYYSRYRIFISNYNSFLLSILVIVFPVLFRLVFDALPFEYLKSERQSQPNATTEDGISQPAAKEFKEQRVVKPIDTDYKLYCIKESADIAEKIFSRAGVYLLVGCLIAFCGIAVFYSPWFTKEYQEPYYGKFNAQATAKDSLTSVNSKLLANTSNRLAVAISDKDNKPDAFWTSEFGLKTLSYIPRFGALFFIEFIALFFLRQYRIMLEEYRYYESIKRRRQDTFNALNILEKYENKPEALASALALFADQPYQTKLSKDETTQLIETHKILNQETDFLGKLGEFVKQVKG